MTNFKTIENWYKNTKVKREIIKYTQNRETALLTPKWAKQDYKNIRTIRTHNTQHIDTIRRWTNCDKHKTPYQYYTSLSKYKEGITRTSLNHTIRKQQTQHWKQTHHQHIIEHDFLIDIDSPSHDEIRYAVDTLKNVKRHLDTIKIPHQIFFTGNGFHIIIPYKYMGLNYNLNPNSDGEKIYTHYSKIAEALKEKYSDLIDMTMYESRRIRKIPYTLALFPHTMYVCTPINTQDEIQNFNLEKYTPQNILNKQYFVEPHTFNKTEKYHQSSIKLKNSLGIK